MNIYFSGDDKNKYKNLTPISKNVLASFFYMNKNLNYKLPENLFLDSGAFSSYQKKQDIDLEHYISFLHTNLSCFSVYAQLDVIGNPVKTLENLKYMESNNLKPLPVFHFGSDFKFLKNLVENYEYIGLGGLVPVISSKTIYSFLNRCFEIGKNNKFHGFGVTKSELLKLYPFFSVDSSSWLNGSKLGEIQQFENDRIVTLRVEQILKNQLQLFSTGFDNQHLYHLLDNNFEKKWKQRNQHNVKEWIKFEKYLGGFYEKF